MLSTICESSRLIKNSVMILLNNTALLLLSWLISIWIARQLGPSNYGIFNLVLWMSNTIVWVLGMGLIHAITKFIAEYQGKNERNQCKPIILFILKIELLISVPTTIVLIFFRSTISTFFFSPNESVYFLIMFIGIIPGLITAVFSAAIEGIQKFEYFTVFNFIASPLSFLAKAYVLYIGKGVNGLLAVMLLFSFINALFYFFVLKREGMFKKTSTRLSQELKKRVLHYNRSVLSIILCDKIVWDKSENFFLGRYSSSTQIGFYNLGYNVANKFVNIFPNTIWKILFPAMSNYCGSKDYDKVKRLFYLSVRYLAFFSFPIGAAGSILSFQIIKFLYGYEYIDAQRVMQLVFLTSIVTSLSKPSSAVLYAFNKQSFIFKYGSVLAFLNIVLNFFLIRQWGAIGAAISYCSITLLGSTGGILYTCKKMKVIIPFIPLAKIFFSTIIMSLVMKIIISKDGSLLGFFLSIVAGFVTYAVCSLSFGSFQQEDLRVLRKIRETMPGFTKFIPGFFIGIITDYKNIEKICE
ncbi:oligosaccharide flippase family protein [Chitinispirillales bacterium ANBcel5]|uniref:oligosaccharide flippase family protein n=1 Tax=Cellulosispirillum alkaliphilum TaxID=3039283 RepID=UPI002A56A20A|nr:oligosaccharide flippase family protein [Chitinispirillales bacterium ANBcel5]